MIHLCVEEILVYGHKMFLTPNSQDLVVLIHTPLPSESGTIGECSTVNPILTSWAVIIEYWTRGMIMQCGEYLTQIRIQAAASFSVNGCEEMMGHTMY